MDGRAINKGKLGHSLRIKSSVVAFERVYATKCSPVSNAAASSVTNEFAFGVHDIAVPT